MCEQGLPRQLYSFHHAGPLTYPVTASRGVVIREQGPPAVGEDWVWYRGTDREEDWERWEGRRQRVGLLSMVRTVDFTQPLTEWLTWLTHYPRAEPNIVNVRFVERVSQSVSPRRETPAASLQRFNRGRLLQGKPIHFPNFQNVPLTVSSAHVCSKPGCDAVWGSFALFLYGFSFFFCDFGGGTSLDSSVRKGAESVGVLTVIWSHFQHHCHSFFLLGRFLFSTWTRFTAQRGESPGEDFKVFSPFRWVKCLLKLVAFCSCELM